MKLRVPNNPLWVEFFGAMGAAPTPMAFAEVYNALQLKVVDGQENPVNVPVSARLYEVQKYLTISNHIADAWVVGINPARFEALSDAHKTGATGGGRRNRGLEGRERRGRHRQVDRHVEANGMEVNELTAEQRAGLRRGRADSSAPTFAGLVKDQAFFDRTVAFVGKK